MHKNEILRTLRQGLFTAALLALPTAGQAENLVVVSTNSPVTLAAGNYTYGSVWLGNDGSGGGPDPLTLNIEDGVTLSCAEFLNGFGVTAVVNQSGGSVTVTGTEAGTGVGNRLSIGVYDHANVGSYNLSGGSLTATAGVATFGADDYGTLTISGGTANLLGIAASWRNEGALTLTSGTLNLGASGIYKFATPYDGAYFANRTPMITFSGGTLKLNDSGAIAVNIGTGTVDALFFDGVQQAAGTWGGTGSGAAHINDTYFTGGGVLTVTTGSGGPVPLDHFTVTAASPQAAGSTFSVTVTAKDASGSTLTTDNSTVVTMTSSGSAQFDSNSDGTFGDSTKTLSNGTLTIHTKDNLAEGVTLTASGAGKTGSSSPITVRSPFQVWANGASFTADTNGDGVANGLAWLLGASGPSDNAVVCLPKGSRSGTGDWVLEFDCLKPGNSGTAALVVQYTKDLAVVDPWNSAAKTPPVMQATVPSDPSTVGGIAFAISASPLGASYQHVLATIPHALASTAGKLFARLQATE